MRISVALAFSIATLCAAVSAIADEPTKAEQRACQVLLKRMAVVTGAPLVGSYCDITDGADLEGAAGYYVIGIRTDDPTRAPGEIYSNLFGWFAVSKTTFAVKGWDMGELHTTPIPRYYYGSAKPKK